MTSLKEKNNRLIVLFARIGILKWKLGLDESIVDRVVVVVVVVCRTYLICECEPEFGASQALLLNHWLQKQLYNCNCEYVVSYC